MPCIAKSFTTTIYKNWHTIACDTILSTIWPSKPWSTYKKPSHLQPFTPHKHMAHHNTIPNSATYIHPHNTHTQKHIHPSCTILLPPPNNSTQWILVIQHDGTLQQAVKINTHPTTAQRTNVLPVMLVFSESQFTFLMEVYFDPMIYFSMIYTTICYFLSVNSQLIFTPSLLMD